MGSSGVRVAHFVVDAFTALKADGGDSAWATGLESDRFPAEMVRGTQFGSYVISGLIPARVVGGCAAVAAAATLPVRLAPSGGGIREPSENGSCTQSCEQTRAPNR